MSLKLPKKYKFYILIKKLIWNSYALLTVVVPIVEKFAAGGENRRLIDFFSLIHILCKI